MADRKYFEDMTKKLIDQGQLLEAGWWACRLQLLQPGLNAPMLHDIHMVWMAACQHVFSSIFVSLDPGVEPTDVDMQRMTSLEREVEGYRKLLEMRVGKPAGSA
jgi:hypothetical protein